MPVNVSRMMPRFTMTVNITAARKLPVNGTRQTDAKHNYVSKPLTASTEGDAVNVRAKLNGDFPGSPVELIHVFQLANNAIPSLEIHS